MLDLYLNLHKQATRLACGTYGETVTRRNSFGESGASSDKYLVAQQDLQYKVGLYCHRRRLDHIAVKLPLLMCSASGIEGEHKNRLSNIKLPHRSEETKTAMTNLARIVSLCNASEMARCSTQIESQNEHKKNDKDQENNWSSPSAGDDAIEIDFSQF